MDHLARAEMIETAARALHESRRQRAALPTWEDLPDWWRQAMRLDAAAALRAAMKETA